MKRSAAAGAGAKSRGGETSEAKTGDGSKPRHAAGAAPSKKARQTGKSPFSAPWIPDFVAAIPGDLKQKLLINLDSLGVLPLASACTGSNITRIAVQGILKQLGAKCKIVEQFTCENNRWKAQFSGFISKFCDPPGGRPCHVFADIADLCKTAAPCLAHPGMCEIPSSGSQALQALGQRDLGKARS